MNKQTLYALIESCRHWDFNRNPNAQAGEKSAHMDNCALCSLFNRTGLGIDMCRGCPVMEQTGSVRCEDSPYMLASVEINGRDYLGAPHGSVGIRREWASCDAEYRFLRGLFPCPNYPELADRISGGLMMQRDDEALAFFPLPQDPARGVPAAGGELFWLLFAAMVFVIALLT